MPPKKKAFVKKGNNNASKLAPERASDVHESEREEVVVGEENVEDASRIRQGRRFEARVVGGERRKPQVPRSQRPSRHASLLQDGSTLVSRK